MLTLGDVPAHSSNQRKLLIFFMFILKATNVNSEIVFMLLFILQFPEHSALFFIIAGLLFAMHNF
jgi:hypothetical protein